MESITIELPEHVLEVIRAIANARRLPASLLVAHVVHDWFREEKKIAAAIDEMLESRMEPTERAPREKDYEIGLAQALKDAGHTVQTQVRTSAGTADMLVNDSIVVELKLALTSWRDVHAATGQARAYAESMGLTDFLVCAPGMDTKFKASRTCDVSEVAEKVVALCHDATVPRNEANVPEFVAVTSRHAESRRIETPCQP